MKIRTGFVSNSSSSSFLLIFDKKPTSGLDVLAHIWPGLGMIGNPYDTFECFPVSKAAEAVWEQVKGQKPLNKEQIVRNFSSSWEAYGDYNSREMSYDERTKAAEAKGPELAKEFLAEAKGKYVYYVSFGDDEGSFGSTMEHGDVFRRIPHKSFSNH